MGVKQRSGSGLEHAGVMVGSTWVRRKHHARSTDRLHVGCTALQSQIAQSKVRVSQRGHAAQLAVGKRQGRCTYMCR